MTKARILADYVSGGTTAAEFDYLDGVTSSIQTQIDAKSPTTGHASIATLGTVTSGTISTGTVMDDPTMTQGSDATGDVYYRAAGGALTRLATGANGTVLTSTGVGAVPAFEAVAAGGDLSFGGDTFGADKTIGSNDNYALSLETNGSTRIKIGGDGVINDGITNTYIGGNPGSSQRGFNFYNDGTNFRIYHSRGSGTDEYTMAALYNGNGLVGTIITNGSACSFNSESDYRLKENQVLISDGITRLKQLKPYRFNFKVDPSVTLDGFFAHEAQEVVPQSATGTKDAVDENGEIDPQGIDHSKLVPLLTSALQEAVTKIEALETENTTLKTRMDALEARVLALES